MTNENIKKEARTMVPMSTKCFEKMEAHKFGLDQDRAIVVHKMSQQEASLIVQRKVLNCDTKTAGRLLRAFNMNAKDLLFELTRITREKSPIQVFDSSEKALSYGNQFVAHMKEKGSYGRTVAFKVDNDTYLLKCEVDRRV